MSVIKVYEDEERWE